jgi:hypothetical protein
MSFDKKKYSTTASANELPVWLVCTFLLNCEEMAYQRNLSGMDDRRFYGGSSVPTDKNGGKVDFTSLFETPFLASEVRILIESNRFRLKLHNLFMCCAALATLLLTSLPSPHRII